MPSVEGDPFVLAGGTSDEAFTVKKDTSVSVRSSALRTLGLGPIEERIYCALLPRDGTSAAEIAMRLALSLRSSQRVLNALEQKGLVTHSPERVQL